MNLHDRRKSVTLTLTREEAWVLHHVMLDRLELSACEPATEPPPLDVVRVLEKLEAGAYRFTGEEVTRIRQDLATYLEAAGAPERDRRAGRRILSRIPKARPHAAELVRPTG